MTTTFTWAGVALGTGGPHRIRSIDGLGVLGGQYAAEEAPSRHGTRRSPVRQDERIITVGGFNDTRAAFDVLAAAFVPAGPGNDDIAELAMNLGGSFRRAGAQLIRFAPVVTPGSFSTRGLLDWVAQWRCPDPRLWGDEIARSSPLVVPVTGIAFPLTFPITLTARPVGGQFSVFNPGADSSPAVFTLTGAQANPGVQVNERRVAYSFPLGADDVLVVDSGSGMATLNGEYRTPVFSWSDVTSDLVLRPGWNTVRALGTAGAGSPTIGVTFAPAYW